MAGTKETHIIIEKAFDTGNLEQALQFAKALAKNSPEDPYGPYALGSTLLLQKRYKHALISFKRALDLDENHYPSMAKLAFAQLKSGQWSEHEQIVDRIKQIPDSAFENGECAHMDPYSCLFLSLPNNLQYKIATARATHFKKTKPEKKFKGYEKLSKKMKIGYLAPSFNDVTIGLMVRGLFAFHNSDKFEIYGYSLERAESVVRQRIEDSCHKFSDFTGVADVEITRRINADGINILVDLCGYGPHARPRILSNKPAPIQCHLLGYPGTLGAQYVQYHISSESMVPEEYLDDFSESVFYQPQTPFATAPFTIPDNNLCRADYHLPEDSTVFASLCEHQHIDPRTFACWMEILNEVEGSVLWLLGGDAEVEQTLRNSANDLNVDPQRIIFAPDEPMATDWHHRLADVWLEPLGYNDGPSLMMALWAGIPVLCWEGDTPQSRLASAYLEAAEMNEMIAESPEEYVRKALELCDNPESLTNLKEKLNIERHHSPLFHPSEYISNLEDRYYELLDHFKATR